MLSEERPRDRKQYLEIGLGRGLQHFSLLNPNLCSVLSIANIHLYTSVQSADQRETHTMSSTRYLRLAFACLKSSFRPVLQSASRPAIGSPSNSWQAQWIRGMKVSGAVFWLHALLIRLGSDVGQATLRRLQGREEEEEICLYHMQQESKAQAAVSLPTALLLAAMLTGWYSQG